MTNTEVSPPGRRSRLSTTLLTIALVVTLLLLFTENHRNLMLNADMQVSATIMAQSDFQFAQDNHVTSEQFLDHAKSLVQKYSGPRFFEMYLGEAERLTRYPAATDSTHASH